MVNHVSAKNASQDNFPCIFPLLNNHTSKDISVFMRQYFVQHYAMHIFQRRSVVVLKRQGMLLFDQEDIVHARMTHVVANCSHHNGENFQLRKYQMQFRHNHQSIRHMSHITAVFEVVVGVRTAEIDNKGTRHIYKSGRKSLMEVFGI